MALILSEARLQNAANPPKSDLEGVFRFPYFQVLFLEGVHGRWAISLFTDGRKDIVAAGGGAAGGGRRVGRRFCEPPETDSS